jgi:hypothetical protein
VTAALYVVHYGKEYLGYSIRSVQDAVDQVFVFYTPVPSFGHGRGLPCPDTEDELFFEANRFAKHPVIWERGVWRNEWQHRDHALETIRRHGHDVVLVVDADEIWDPEAAKKAVYRTASELPVARRHTARFANFWRSWKWMVHDHFRPIRIVDLRAPEGLTVELEDQAAPVYHFGYAQRLDLMRYKWTCHGHQTELRSGWVDRFVHWKPDDEDLHPVVNHLWDRAHATPDDVAARLAEMMPDHPYREVDLID